MKEYFTDKELTCRCGCGKNNFDPTIRGRLNQAREIAKIPFRINSACRCLKHNTDIGSKPTSSHILGLAMDIAVTTDHERFLILSSLILLRFKRIEIGINYIHVDGDEQKPQEICWLHPKILKGEKE
jgi:hypothetical protein